MSRMSSYGSDDEAICNSCVVLCDPSASSGWFAMVGVGRSKPEDDSGSDS